jgi:hypothetical protein
MMLATEVNKRKRGEQLEPTVPHISETRLPFSNFSQSLIQHAQSFFPFIPDNSYHPPFAIEFLETLNDICRCESSLNTSSTATEIRDVRADCQLIYSRIFNEQNPTLMLLERAQDLESNIKLKFLRCCHRIIRHAAQMADDINAFRYTSAASVHVPSIVEIESTLKTTDNLAFSLHAELEPLKFLYLHKIRPVLVSHWEDEPSSEDEYVPALSAPSERELHPTE